MGGGIFPAKEKMKRLRLALAILTGRAEPVTDPDIEFHAYHRGVDFMTLENPSIDRLRAEIDYLRGLAERQTSPQYRRAATHYADGLQSVLNEIIHERHGATVN